jgi:hypothetical protein
MYNLFANTINEVGMCIGENDELERQKMRPFNITGRFREWNIAFGSTASFGALGT